MVKHYDMLFKNGTIIDGTGSPRYEGDLGVVDGRIEAIGRLEAATADRELNVEGLVVAPGFIDAHSHSDLGLLTCPTGDSKVMQGVTTELIGHCGSSAAPVTQRSADMLLEYLGSAGIEEVEWRTLAEYREVIEERGISQNAAPLVGHGTLRGGVVGYEARSATDDELQEMERILAESLEAGAYGLSSGLIYPPGSYAPTEELEALARVIGRIGGVYSTHLRSEADELEEAVDEALQIGRAGGIPVLISHHKAAGKRNWGKLTHTIEKMRLAREAGQEVACDVYPYLAGSTSLPAILPGWAHEGGPEALLERLRVFEHRRRIAREFETGLPGWENLAGLAGWENIMVTNVYPGKTIAEIGSMRGVDPAEAAFDLILEQNGKVGMVLFMMDEADLRSVLRSPWTMIGSDAGVQAKDASTDSKPHPRAFGTFPRVLGHYVRDEEVLPLEEAVRRMTMLPATYLGMTSRGRLAPGMYADIVVFDPETVADQATYVEPRRYPRGIPHVFVRGVAVVENGEHTGARPGHVLQRGRD